MKTKFSDGKTEITFEDREEKALAIVTGMLVELAARYADKYPRAAAALDNLTRLDQSTPAAK